MRLTYVRGGDIVRVNIKGRSFLAHVHAKQGNRLDIDPIPTGISYRRCSGRDVVAHWQKRGRPQSGDE